MKKILKYEIPVDDRIHEIPIDKVLHAVALAADTVTVWGIYSGKPRQYKVVGTGHEFDDGYVHQATARYSGRLYPNLVWHVMRVPS